MGFNILIVAISSIRNETYICDQNFHISIYYLAQEEITALEKADKDTEPMVMWEILRNTLGWHIKIADRKGRVYCQEI